MVGGTIVTVADFRANVKQRAPNGGPAADALLASTRGLVAVFLDAAMQARLDALGTPEGLPPLTAPETISLDPVPDPVLTVASAPPAAVPPIVGPFDGRDMVSAADWRTLVHARFPAGSVEARELLAPYAGLAAVLVTPELRERLRELAPEPAAAPPTVRLALLPSLANTIEVVEPDPETDEAGRIPAPTAAQIRAQLDDEATIASVRVLLAGDEREHVIALVAQLRIPS